MKKGKGIWYVIACILVIGIMTTTYTNKLLTKQQSEKSLPYPTSESSFMDQEAVRRSYQTKIPDEGKEEAAPGAGVPGAETSGESASVTSKLAAASDQDQPSQEFLEKREEDEDELVIAEQAEAPSLARTPLETIPASPAAPATLQEDSDASEYINRLNELDAQIMRIREEETDSNTYSMKSTAENELKLWDSELNSVYNKILEKVSEEDAAGLIMEEREWMKERDALAVMAAKKSNAGAEGIEYTASLAASTRQRTYDLAEAYHDILESP